MVYNIMIIYCGLRDTLTLYFFFFKLSAAGYTQRAEVLQCKSSVCTHIRTIKCAYNYVKIRIIIQFLKCKANVVMYGEKIQQHY